MSTAAPPRRTFDHDESQRRVRHPLQTVRKYIRAYVLLEGLALAALFLATWFWIGLLFDYGIFRLFAYDWIQELRELSPGTGNTLIVRIVILVVVAAVLLALVVTKVALRWIREFQDHSLALLLERRFPRELGDRLMTAVELADPKIARRYGFSEAMIEQTIHDAVKRLERLPVASVFNWGRLVLWWIGVAIVTFGLLVVVAITTLTIGLTTGDLASPLELPWRMADVGIIYAERNMLLQNSYWPRSAHLEFVRFQGKKDNPNEMRVPRDEQRPDLQVRAVQWVVADSTAPDGWRALRWQDLSKFVDKDLLARVDIPENWPHWIIDLDDLDLSVPNGVFPPNLQDRTSGEIREALLTDAKLKKNVQDAEAEDAVDQLLNWKRWTVDQIAQQETRPAVRNPMRETDAHAALEAVLEKLEALAASPSMSRTLRKLARPEDVKVRTYGAATELSEPCIKHGHKFAFDFMKLKESSRVRMSIPYTAWPLRWLKSADYHTAAKAVTLVAPPGIKRLSVDKQEPAYLYHRLQGGAQLPLKEQKQVFRDYAISINGELSTIDVPFGADVTVRVESDRKLKKPIQIASPAARESGSIVPGQPVGDTMLGASTVGLMSSAFAPGEVLAAAAYVAGEGQKIVLDLDGQTFSTEFKNIVRTLDFMFEFIDEDHVRGRRHVRIKPSEDLPPKFEGEVGLGVLLRKPRARGADSRGGQTTVADGLLITPDALLPFLGQIRDDHGMTRAGWLIEVEAIDFELVGAGKDSKEKLPTLVLGGNSQLRRAGLIASILQYNPTTPVPRLMIPSYLNWVDRVLAFDLKRAESSQLEKFVMMDEFDNMVQRKPEIPQTQLAELLQKPARQLPPWVFNLKEEGVAFDVRRLLPQLKAANPEKEAQLHYMIKLSVIATDNNIEEGKPWTDAKGTTFWGNSTRSKNRFQFLVVTENELLAQIVLEEESLSERLEGAYDRLKTSKTKADEQLIALSNPLTDEAFNSVSFRLDEVRKSIIDAGSIGREVTTAYSNILKEMKANRVAKDRVEKIEDNIVWPLERTTHPVDGNFVKTDDLFQKAYQEADDDAQAKRGVKNAATHVANITNANKELDELMARINSVLVHIQKGVTKAQALEQLIAVERRQREVLDSLRLREARIWEELLDVLKEKKKP